MNSLPPGTPVWVTLPSTKSQHLAEVIEHHRERGQVEIAWNPRGDKSTVTETTVHPIDMNERTTRRQADTPPLDDGATTAAATATSTTAHAGAAPPPAVQAAVAPPHNNAVSAPRAAAACSNAALPPNDGGPAAAATATATKPRNDTVSAPRGAAAAACIVERRDFEQLLGTASAKAGKPKKRADGRATMTSSSQNRAAVEGDTNPQGVKELIDAATAARSKAAAGGRRAPLLPVDVLRQGLVFLDPLGGTGEVALQAALVHGFEATSIEVVEGRHAIACSIKDKLAACARAASTPLGLRVAAALARVTLRFGDCRDHADAFRRAHVIFLNNDGGTLKHDGGDRRRPTRGEAFVPTIDGGARARALALMDYLYDRWLIRDDRLTYPRGAQAASSTTSSHSANPTCSRGRW